MNAHIKGKPRLLLIFPQFGLSGELVKHIPLALLYAAVDTIKNGFEVDILDVRLDPYHWRERLSSKITPDTFMIGISVLTGTPILNAIEISHFVKQNFPHVNVVWGGPHATFNALDILSMVDIDYVITGYGSKPLALLAGYLTGTLKSIKLADIPGVAYKNDGVPTLNPPEPEFEFIDYKDIPYHLVERDLERYGQLDSGDSIFSMYSAMGCPYNCAFCSSPAIYRRFKKKYIKLSPEQVVDHVQYVHEKYGANYIYFIDDDSFVDFSHVEAVIDDIRRRGIKVKVGFRGARVSEIKRMSNDFLTKLADAGTDILHIGAESGSQRMLDMFNKNCTVEDILEVNRKLANHPKIKAGYNWVVGIPGESTGDLKATQRLMMQILKENPKAIFFVPNKFRPLPGTEMYELAVSSGYSPPTRQEEWADIEVEGSFTAAWITPQNNSIIQMMQLTSYFIDDKINKVNVGDSFRYRVVRLMAKVYAPIAKLRMKNNWHKLMPEKYIYRIAVRIMQRMAR